MEHTTGTAALDPAKLSSMYFHVLPCTKLQSDISNTKYVSRPSILLLLHSKLFCRLNVYMIILKCRKLKSILNAESLFIPDLTQKPIFCTNLKEILCSYSTESKGH